jgi:hypothetical protein
MRNHWSCTKFADRIRGAEKPDSASGKEWNRWETDAKAKHPIRYWITEEALDAIQGFIWWPVDKLYKIKYYIVNRWFDQSHALVSHQKHIKPGDWCDLGDRMLYCLFDELVDFVEIEKAYSNYRWDEEKIKTLEWWQGGRWRTRTWRSAEAGLNHLSWEMSLTDEEWITDKSKAKPTAQADAAREIVELYKWWIEVYPNRPDPMDASGWSAYCDSKRDNLLDVLEEDNGMDTQPMLDKIRELEEQYQKEDTEMLIRLIKIRGHLWT